VLQEADLLAVEPVSGRASHVDSIHLVPQLVDIPVEPSGWRLAVLMNLFVTNIQAGLSNRGSSGRITFQD
jgi:hypothetical protein